MNSKLENRLSMLRTVGLTLSNIMTLISTIPALLILSQSFMTLLEKIEKMVQNQIQQIRGIAEAKASARAKLIEKVMVASGIIRSYALNTGDIELRGRVKISRSKLLHMRDEIMYDASKLIIDIAASMQAQLSSFGLTPAQLADMQMALENYHNRIETPAVARANRKLYTERLKELIDEATNLLREGIDGNIEVLAAAHPDEVGKYKKSRMIADYTSGRRKKEIDDENIAVISGTVTDADGFGVADVKVIVENTGISTTTDNDGEYLIDTLPAGKYNLIVSMEGYKETRENDFSVVAGDDVVKDFVIEAEETI